MPILPSLPVCLIASLSTYEPLNHPPIHVSTCLSICLCPRLSDYVFMCVPMCLCARLSVCMPIDLYIYPRIYFSSYVSSEYSTIFLTTNPSNIRSMQPCVDSPMYGVGVVKVKQSTKPGKAMSLRFQ
jgi:hypothetical protein